MNNRANFIKEANSMLIGMAPHVASRKTANMLREAVVMLSADSGNDQLVKDLDHQIDGFKDYIKSIAVEIQKLPVRDFAGEPLISKCDVLKIFKT